MNRIQEYISGLNLEAFEQDYKTVDAVIRNFEIISFDTVNGIPGQGGAIDGPGPVIAHGMVLFNSGYGLFGQMPGNVLLVFSVD